MAILNVTYQGVSADVAELDPETPDDDVRRTAVEIVRSGEFPRLHDPGMAPDGFEDFVVDRFDTVQGQESRFYLRPKVPFG